MTSIKFLHTSDWQLGMTRHFLDAGVAERFAHDRLRAVREMGRIAAAEGCAFMIVAGDVFESNQVARNTILRALAALAEVPVPVYLLPANHDPLNEASVYTNRLFVSNKPANVTVIADDQPLAVADGVELIGAPWRGVRLAENPVTPLLRRLETAGDRLRILVAHGEVDVLAPMSDSATRIAFDDLRAAVDDGRAHYVALGDKHSPARLDAAGRIRYSGTPEATAFREPDPGHALIVQLTGDGIETKDVRVGTWTFTELERDLVSSDEMRIFLDDLNAFHDKERHVVRVAVSGRLGLPDVATLRNRLEELGELFASFECDQSGLHVGVEDSDIEDSGLTGFAAAAAARLKAQMDAGGEQAVVARDALLLLTSINQPFGKSTTFASPTDP